MSPEIRDALFWGAVACCAVAQLFIIRAVWRAAPGARHSAVPTPNRLLELAWAVVPGVLLAATFLWTWRLMHPALP